MNTAAVCVLDSCHKKGSFEEEAKRKTYLCLTDVLHSEIEPDSETRVARVWPDEEVKLELTDVVNAAQVSCRSSQNSLH